MPEESTSAAYPDLHWHEHYSKEFSKFDYFGNINAHRSLFLSIFRERPKSILEVGSGSGTMSVFLSYFIKRTVSIDNNQEVLENGKLHNSKFRGNAAFIFGDAFKLPFKDDEFDIAFSQGFFEHFTKEQIILLIDEQLRVAKKVVISVPNSDFSAEGVGDELRLGKKEWEALLSKYKIIESRNYGRAAFRLFMNKPGHYLAKITKREK